MSQRQVVTLPGPGGSTISCCIIPCGCILVLLAGLLVGGLALGLRLHGRRSLARVAPAAGAPLAATVRTLPGR